MLYYKFTKEIIKMKIKIIILNFIHGFNSLCLSYPYFIFKKYILTPSANPLIPIFYCKCKFNN